MSETIRVLQVLGRMDRGGAEAMIMNIYRNIDRQKVQFDFIVHTDAKCAFDDEINELGGEIYRVPKYKVYNHFSYKKAWKDILKRLSGTHKIIHGHVYSTASIYLKIAKKFGLYTIAHSHNTSNGAGIQAKIKDFLQRSINKCADKKFACGVDAGKWLFKNDDFEVINNAIDVAKYAYNPQTAENVRRDLNIVNKFVVGHVGRFDYQKNHEFLIDIFYEIQKYSEDAVLILVGDGELRLSMQEKVDKLRIADKVLFLGVRNDVSKLMQAMDIFLFPSHYEGLSVVLIEAQAAGLPIYTSSTVVRETDVTKTIRFIGFENTATYWANIILQSGNMRKVSDVRLVVESGYDIKQSAVDIQSIYEDIAENNLNKL